MRIHVTDPTPVQLPAAYERQNLILSRHHRSGQVRQRREHESPVRQIAKRNFAKHERMDHHLGAAQRAGQHFIAKPQMIHPDRRVDQQH